VATLNLPPWNLRLSIHVGQRPSPALIMPAIGGNACCRWSRTSRARPARKDAAHCLAQRARKGSARGKPRLSVSPSRVQGEARKRRIVLTRNGCEPFGAAACGAAPLHPREGRTRRALVLPSCTLLRAPGAGKWASSSNDDLQAPLLQHGSGMNLLVESAADCTRGRGRDKVSFVISSAIGVGLPAERRRAAPAALTPPLSEPREGCHSRARGGAPGCQRGFARRVSAGPSVAPLRLGARKSFLALGLGN